MTVYLAYPLTHEAEKAEFARTGKRPATIGTGMYQLPYTAMTDEEFMALPEADRGLIVYLGGFLAAPRSAEFAARLPERMMITTNQYDGPKTYGEYTKYDHPLTVYEWLYEAGTLVANNNQAKAEVEQARREWLQGRIDAKAAEIEAGQSSGLFSTLHDEAKRLGLDLSAYDAAVAAMEERKAAEVAANRAAAEARNQAEEAMRKLQEQSKAAWVEAHGSDHLKRACARGHDCQRLYVTERAALELPEYTVDFEDNAQWKDRACPTTAALDEAERVERLDLRPADEIEVLIVWLTSPARAERLEYDEDPGEFEECEAVVVRGYLGKYDLVRQM